LKIKEIKDFISKHTMNTRYKMMFKITKHLTPQLNERFSNASKKVTNTPRPAITTIKKRSRNIPLTGAEIGVQRGDNAQSMLDELNIEKLYLIDVWDLISFNKTQEGHSLVHRDHINLANYYGHPFISGGKKYLNINNYSYVSNRFKDNKKLKLIKDSSNVAVEQFRDDSLDFVYIDANHSYKKVLEDISIWAKKVKTNGIISGHDTHRIDVLQAVIDYSIKHGQHLIIEHPDWYFIKHNKGSEFKKEREEKLGLWCTKCDVDLIKKGIALDCPEDGIFYECPSCNYRVVIFKI